MIYHMPHWLAGHLRLVSDRTNLVNNYNHDYLVARNVFRVWLRIY